MEILLPYRLTNSYQFESCAKRMGFDEFVMRKIIYIFRDSDVDVYPLMGDERLTLLLYSWQLCEKYIKSQNCEVDDTALFMLRFLSSFSLRIWFSREWQKCSHTRKAGLIFCLDRAQKHLTDKNNLCIENWYYLMHLNVNPWQREYLLKILAPQTEIKDSTYLSEDIEEKATYEDVQFLKQEGLIIISLRLMELFDSYSLVAVKKLAMRAIVAWHALQEIEERSTEIPTKEKDCLLLICHIYLMAIYEADNTDGNVIDYMIHNIKFYYKYLSQYETNDSVQFTPAAFIALACCSVSVTIPEFQSFIYSGGFDDCATTVFGASLQAYKSYVVGNMLMQLNALNEVEFKLYVNDYKQLVDKYIEMREKSEAFLLNEIRKLGKQSTSHNLPHTVRLNVNWKRNICKGNRLLREDDDIMENTDRRIDPIFQHMPSNLDVLLYTYKNLSFRAYKGWHFAKLVLLLKIINRKLNSIETWRYHLGLKPEFMIELEQKIACHFEDLAKIFHEHPFIEQELWLTAFYLYPKEPYFESITRCGTRFRKLQSNKENYQKMVKMKNEKLPTNFINAKYGLLSCTVESEIMLAIAGDDPPEKDHKVLSMALKEIKLPDSIINDLLIATFAPRNRMFSWAIQWPELRRRCKEYLNNSSIKRRFVELSMADANNRLKFLNIDYEKYKHRPQIDYGSIEKGYEDCVVFDDSEEDDSDDDYESEEEPVVKKKPGRPKPVQSSFEEKKKTTKPLLDIPDDLFGNTRRTRARVAAVIEAQYEEKSSSTELSSDSSNSNTFASHSPNKNISSSAPDDENATPNATTPTATCATITSTTEASTLLNSSSAALPTSTQTEANRLESDETIDSKQKEKIFQNSTPGFKKFLDIWQRPANGQYSEDLLPGRGVMAEISRHMEVLSKLRQVTEEYNRLETSRGSSYKKDTNQGKIFDNIEKEAYQKQTETETHTNTQTEVAVDTDTDSDPNSDAEVRADANADAEAESNRNKLTYKQNTYQNNHIKNTNANSNSNSNTNANVNVNKNVNVNSNGAGTSDGNDDGKETADKSENQEETCQEEQFDNDIDIRKPNQTATEALGQTSENHLTNSYVDEKNHQTNQIISNKLLMNNEKQPVTSIATPIKSTQQINKRKYPAAVAAVDDGKLDEESNEDKEEEQEVIKLRKVSNQTIGNQEPNLKHKTKEQADIDEITLPSSPRRTFAAVDKSSTSGEFPPNTASSPTTTELDFTTFDINISDELDDSDRSDYSTTALKDCEEVDDLPCSPQQLNDDPAISPTSPFDDRLNLFDEADLIRAPRSYTLSPPFSSRNFFNSTKVNNLNQFRMAEANRVKERSEAEPKTKAETETDTQTESLKMNVAEEEAKAKEPENTNKLDDEPSTSRACGLNKEMNASLVKASPQMTFKTPEIFKQALEECKKSLAQIPIPNPFVTPMSTGSLFGPKQAMKPPAPTFNPFHVKSFQSLNPKPWAEAVPTIPNFFSFQPPPTYYMPSDMVDPDDMPSTSQAAYMRRMVREAVKQSMNRPKSLQDQYEEMYVQNRCPKVLPVNYQKHKFFLCYKKLIESTQDVRRRDTILYRKKVQTIIKAKYYQTRIVDCKNDKIKEIIESNRNVSKNSQKNDKPSTDKNNDKDGDKDDDKGATSKRKANEEEGLALPKPKASSLITEPIAKKPKKCVTFVDDLPMDKESKGDKYSASKTKSAANAKAKIKGQTKSPVKAKAKAKSKAQSKANNEKGTKAQTKKLLFSTPTCEANESTPQEEKPKQEEDNKDNATNTDKDKDNDDGVAAKQGDEANNDDDSNYCAKYRLYKQKCQEGCPKQGVCSSVLISDESIPQSGPCKEQSHPSQPLAAHVAPSDTPTCSASEQEEFKDEEDEEEHQKFLNAQIRECLERPLLVVLVPLQAKDLQVLRQPRVRLKRCRPEDLIAEWQEQLKRDREPHDSDEEELEDQNLAQNRKRRRRSSTAASSGSSNASVNIRKRKSPTSSDSESLEALRTRKQRRRRPPQYFALEEEDEGEEEAVEPSVSRLSGAKRKLVVTPRSASGLRLRITSMTGERNPETITTQIIDSSGSSSPIAGNEPRSDECLNPPMVLLPGVNMTTNARRARRSIATVSLIETEETPLSVSQFAKMTKVDHPLYEEEISC